MREAEYYTNYKTSLKPHQRPQTWPIHNNEEDTKIKTLTDTFVCSLHTHKYRRTQIIYQKLHY
jgi:hypothetical protein